jgi:predicted DNA-binding transcriptional regulator AlpA
MKGERDEMPKREGLTRPIQIRREPEAARMLGLSTVTLARRRKDGTGPTPIKLGPRHYGYSDEALEKYAAEREERKSVNDDR